MPLAVFGKFDLLISTSASLTESMAEVNLFSVFSLMCLNQQ